MTHDLAAAWTVSGATGTVSGNQGESVSFEVVAGQTYTVGFSTSGGLGYYTLDATQTSSFSYVDWGTISSVQHNGLSVSGEAGIALQPARPAAHDLEALFAAQSGQVNLKLYDANLQLVTSGTGVNGVSRVGCQCDRWTGILCLRSGNQQ